MSAAPAPAVQELESAPTAVFVLEEVRATADRAHRATVFWACVVIVGGILACFAVMNWMCCSA